MMSPSNDAVTAPTRRLRMTVAYDGRPFQGWQSQAQGNTIQDHLEAALAPLCRGQRVVVHGSGRTDAGVHAHGQVAHADVTSPPGQPAERWRAAMNAHLPPEIRVQAARFVSDKFHARFSARGKIYRYRIWNAAVLDPFEHRRAWHVAGELDIDVLRRTAAMLVGEHDFAGFAANRGKPVKSTVRAVHRITLQRRLALLTLEFEGSGFLYKMVRLMTGSLVRCAQGRASPDWIAALLSGGAGKTHFAAPAEGLYLLRVLYGRRRVAS